jgi:hypothetical protein
MAKESHGGFLMNKKLMKYFVCVSMLVATFTTIGVPFASADTPAAPSEPYPAPGSNGVTVFVYLHWTGDNQTVTYDVYFGNESVPPLVISNVTTTTYNPGKLHENTTYYWKIVSFNAEQESTESPVWMFATSPDTPPFHPTILGGPATAAKGIALNFSAIALDPEGDPLFYQWNWGDGNFSEWVGPYVFGASVATTHLYAENGTYEITVHAKDAYGKESTWSESYAVRIQPQFRFYNLHQGFVYLNFFGFDIGYGYSYALDQALWTMFVSNEAFMSIVNVSENVSYMKYKMTNLVYQDEHWVIIDENITNFTSVVYFPIDTGFYNITAFAYDGHGNMIGRTMRNWVIYVNWKWPIINRLLGRK